MDKKLELSPEGLFVACRTATPKNEYHWNWDKGLNHIVGNPIDVIVLRDEYQTACGMKAISPKVRKRPSFHQWCGYHEPAPMCEDCLAVAKQMGVDLDSVERKIGHPSQLNEK